MDTVHRRDGGSNYKAGYDAGFPGIVSGFFVSIPKDEICICGRTSLPY